MYNIYELHLFTEYVQSNYKEIARTALIDTINDKCAQCRRRLKRTEAM